MCVGSFLVNIGFCFSKLHHEERMSAYKDFCKSMETQSLEACLMTDLRVGLGHILYEFITVNDTLLASAAFWIDCCMTDVIV